MSETREEIARVLAARERGAAGLESESERSPGGRTAGLPIGPRRGSADSVSRGPEKVRDVLKRVLKRRGLHKQMEYQKVIDDWPRLVGPGVARVTRARSVANGVLIVEVASSAWAMELNMRKRQIMARLNAGRPIRLRRVVFVLSGGG